MATYYNVVDAFGKWVCTTNSLAKALRVAKESGGRIQMFDEEDIHDTRELPPLTKEEIM